MKIKIGELQNLCYAALTNVGVKRSNAKIIADDYIEGSLLGNKTHGLLTFSYAIEKAKKTKNKKFKIEKKSQSYALINANAQLGQLVAPTAINLVCTMAKKYGIAMVGVYNLLPFLRPGTQAEKIAAKDLVGLVLINGGGPLVAAPGSVDKIISTNPIGFAIPTIKEPIVCDMAISKKAYGEVRLAKLLGTKLPADSFIDENGKITTNPDDVFAALPFGDYKGFNLGILFEILTGSLVNFGIGYQKKPTEKTNKKYKKTFRGALFIAINPKAFTSLSSFKKKNNQFVKEINSLKKRKGIKEILVPGQRSYRHKQQVLKQGWLELDKKIIDQIKELAD